jgi:hypothetical protein
MIHLTVDLRGILQHNESQMGTPSTVTERAEVSQRVSVTLSRELYAEISARAEEHDMSLNRVLTQLIRTGLEAEREKKHHLEDLLRRYRESTNPEETARLSDELGAMIFGR